MAAKINNFTQSILAWYHTNGRRDLPWKLQPTPYRVWVSEIMLQQTQVSTVIDYYQIFMERFSCIESLSEASLDEVLSLWSGLGYYARARNLHTSAKIIVHEQNGRFPQNLVELIKLPGIGRSTAGAILSLSMNIRAIILDGNVKRVLSRFHAVKGAPSEARILKQLWDLAEQETPLNDYDKYNQAIMDLGATICTRSKPLCHLCPVIDHCQAYALSQTNVYPQPKKKKVRYKKSVYVLILKNKDNHILLEKRPMVGIWGGLWSFPECEMTANIKDWCQQVLDLQIIQQKSLPIIIHQFTHFELLIQPVMLMVKSASTLRVMEGEPKVWYNLSAPLPGGIPAPVTKLLNTLKGEL